MDFIEPHDIRKTCYPGEADLPLLRLAGGIMGVILGRGTSFLASKVFHWPTAPSLGAIVAAVVVSASVGLIFGFYPAWKGSRLDPIDALRYE